MRRLDPVRFFANTHPTRGLKDLLRSVCLRKLKVREREAAGGQLTAFLTALFKAVEGSPNVVKGIRRGIELGEYVYQSGDLICGLGAPWASIHIDEQSFVHTSAHAKANGVFPKVADKSPESGADTNTGGTSSRSGGSSRSRSGSSSGSSGGTTGGSGTSTGTGKADSTGRTGSAGDTGKTADAPPQSNALTEEGVLKEALTKLWERARERARARKFTHIRAIELRLFDATDAFRLLGLVAAIQGAAKQVALSGGYVTTDGGSLTIDFTGPPADAQPIKDFLDPQLRAAKERDLEARFDIRFDDAGLALAGDAAEKLTERLTRFGTGAAYVSITAEGSA